MERSGLRFAYCWSFIGKGPRLQPAQQAFFVLFQKVTFKTVILLNLFGGVTFYSKYKKKSVFFERIAVLTMICFRSRNPVVFPMHLILVQEFLQFCGMCGLNLLMEVQRWREKIQFWLDISVSVNFNVHFVQSVIRQGNVTGTTSMGY